MEGVRIRVAIKPPRPALQKREGGGEPGRAPSPPPQQRPCGAAAAGPTRTKRGGAKAAEFTRLGAGAASPPPSLSFFFFLFSSLPPIQSLIHNLHLATVFLIHVPLPLGHCQSEHKSLLCRGLISRDLRSWGWLRLGYIQSLLKLSIGYVYGNTKGISGHPLARK